MAKSWARGDYELPEFLAKAPKLLPHLELWWNAFWDLCGDRSGMGDGRILWSAAHAWAQAHDLDSAAEFELHCHIKSMDTVFLKHQAEEAKRGK